MSRRAGVTALLAFLAGALTMLLALDRLIGPYQVHMSADHRRLLDRNPWGVA